MNQSLQTHGPWSLLTATDIAIHQQSEKRTVRTIRQKATTRRDQIVIHTLRTHYAEKTAMSRVRIDWHAPFNGILTGEDKELVTSTCFPLSATPSIDSFIPHLIFRCVLASL